MPPIVDSDTLLRIDYATKFGILDPYDSPPCWEDLFDHAREAGRWEHAKEHAHFKDAIALLLGLYADQHTSEQIVAILALELRIGRAAHASAHAAQRQAADLRRALISLLSAKPRRFSMFRDGELLALADRRARSPLWRLVARVIG